MLPCSFEIALPHRPKFVAHRRRQLEQFLDHFVPRANKRPCLSKIRFDLGEARNVLRIRIDCLMRRRETASQGESLLTFDVCLPHTALDSVMIALMNGTSWTSWFGLR